MRERVKGIARPGRCPGSEHEGCLDTQDQSSVNYGFKLGSENQPGFPE